MPAASVVPAFLLHPSMFEDLTCDQDRLTDPVIDRMTEVLLVEDRYVHSHIRPHIPLFRIGNRRGIRDHRLTHVRGLAGFREGDGNLSDITKHRFELLAIRTLLIDVRKRAVEINLEPDLDKRTLLIRQVIGLGVIANFPFPDSCAELFLIGEEACYIQVIFHGDVCIPPGGAELALGFSDLVNRNLFY